MSNRLTSMFGRAAARRRVIFAIASNGFVSLTSLLLAVAIARRSDTWEFGQFSIAMAIYLFVIGLIRAAITETTLAVDPTSAANGRGFRRAALVSLVAALSLLTVGLLADNAYLVVIAVALNGLVCLDYVRTVEAALYKARNSLIQGVLWSALTAAASISSIVVPIDPLLVFGIWAASGAVIGYLSALLARLSLIPWWAPHSAETKAAWLFSLDYAAGSGGSALSTAVLGVTSSAATVGALRGAGTILGPASLLSTTVRSLIIPYLSAARRIGGPYEFRRAVAIAAGLAVVLAIPAGLLCLLPARIGTALLGSTWHAAAPLLPALAIESVLALVGNIASAGHRSRLAGVRSLALRFSVGIPRPFVIIAAAAAMGALGAAWAMAALSVANCVIWWLSYWQLSRAAEPDVVPAS